MSSKSSITCTIVQYILLSTQFWLCRHFFSVWLLTMQTRCPCDCWQCRQSIRVIVDYEDVLSVWLLTMQTKCPCNCWLFRHCVRVIVDYADKVSVLLLTIQTLCPCYCWLWRHCAVLLLTMQTKFPCYGWLCRQSVHVMVDYANKVSMWLLTMRTFCLCGCWLCRHCVVLLLTMQTKCLCYGWLCKQSVHVIVDYADILFVWLLTMQTKCLTSIILQGSIRQCRKWENIQPIGCQSLSCPSSIYIYRVPVTIFYIFGINISSQPNPDWAPKIFFFI